MTTKFTKHGVTILISFLMLTLIAGCISTPEQPPTLPNTTTTNNSPQNDDFAIHINKDWRHGINGTDTITKNLSEIIANNYTDIPNLLKPIDYDCGYTQTTNYSQVADVALHNPHIQKVLRNGGVIHGIYISKPEHHTEEMSQENYCNYVHITLEFTYQKTQHDAAWINATTRQVLVDSDVLQQFG